MVSDPSKDTLVVHDRLGIRTGRCPCTEGAETDSRQAVDGPRSDVASPRKGRVWPGPCRPGGSVRPRRRNQYSLSCQRSVKPVNPDGV